MVDTLERAISERMSVRSTGKYLQTESSSSWSKDTAAVLEDQQSHQRAKESCGAKGVSMVSVAVCSVHLLFPESHHHVDTTSSQVCLRLVCTPACITLAVTKPRVRFTSITMMWIKNILKLFWTFFEF